jgi:hypothetical protein
MSNFIGGLQSETCGRKIRRMCIIDDVTNYKGKSERKERQKDRQTDDGRSLPITGMPPPLPKQQY